MSNVHRLAFPSLDETTLSSSMPQLPPEIWLSVFELLCHIPAAMDVDNHLAIEAYSEDANGIILHNHLSTLAQTKLALANVCWLWRGLALPFLYRDIIITNGRYALKLAATLQTLRYRCIAQQQPFPGRWIKRVEIFAEARFWDDDRHKSLVVILENAPNLVVFSDAFCAVPSNLLSYAPLVKQMGTLCTTGSLRRLEWYCDTPVTLDVVLKRMPLLEVLILCRGHITSEVKDPITLPRLRVLSIGPYVGLSRFACMVAPLLQTVLLFRSVTIGDCEEFLSWLASCDKLKHLRMSSSDALATGRSLDMQQMTFLQTMTIDFGQWRKFTRPLVGRFRHDNLRRINLSNFAFMSSSLYWHNYHKDFHWSTTFTFMHSLLDAKTLPLLKTIGLYIPHGYHQEDEFGEVVSSLGVFWRPWLTECRERDIAVELCLSADDHLKGIWRPFLPVLSQLSA